MAASVALVRRIRFVVMNPMIDSVRFSLVAGRQQPSSGSISSLASAWSLPATPRAVKVAVILPANSVGTKQLKKGAVTNKKIGKNAVTGAKVKNGSLRGTDFAAGQLPAGPQGPQGVQGVRGEPGPFSDLLPSGKTLRGEFGITGAGVTNNYGDVSFGFRLASDPTPNVIEEGGASTAGTATDPEAAPATRTTSEYSPAMASIAARTPIATELCSTPRR